MDVPAIAAARARVASDGPALGLLDAGVQWDHVTELRERWNVPVIVKGLVTAEDAILACEHGASAVVVSNHGGRQLDGAIASLEALPEVVEAVGDRAEVYLDGGVRRGSDVVMALALGARAVLVGRPAMYGLAFGGDEGRAAGARDPPRRDRERARPARLPLAGRDHACARHEARVRVSIAELTRNAVHVLPEGALEAKLALGRPLRVKLGIDVTAPDVTLGNGIPLQRMAAFQREGHVGVLIVGDYTTRIGDPSGRSAARPILSDEEIERNAQRFVEQASTIIDPERTEVRFNGEWLAKLDFAEILRLTRTTTVAQILERDDFAKRHRAREPISISELLYPLMQAYDSVAVEADVELGGTDQLYNLLAGREVMAGLRARAPGRAHGRVPR